MARVCPRGTRAVWALAAALACLVGAAKAQSAKSTVLIAGSPTFQQVLVKAKSSPLKPYCGVKSYLATSSENGQLNFMTGDYVIGISDSPMTLDREQVYDSIGGKLTIPLLVVTYGFYIGTTKKVSPTVRLNPKITYNIYKSGGGATWAAYNRTVVDGLQTLPWAMRISPIGRLDVSGINAVLRRYWKLGNTTFARDYPTPPPTEEHPLPFTGVTYVGSAESACNFAARKLGSIVYSQTKLCQMQVNQGTLKEAYMQDATAAWDFNLPSGGLPQKMIPRVIPSATAFWYQMANAVMYQKDAPAMVSVLYAFVRNKKPQPQAKAVLWCLINQLSPKAGSFGFIPLPPRVIRQNQLAMRLL